MKKTEMIDAPDQISSSIWESHERTSGLHDSPTRSAGFLLAFRTERLGVLRNFAFCYGRCTMIEVIWVAIDIVLRKCIACTGNYELTLLSRTVTPATQNASVNREIVAAPCERLHVINVEVLLCIPMDKATLFTDIVRLTVAKFISPGC